MAAHAVHADPAHCAAAVEHPPPPPAVERLVTEVNDAAAGMERVRTAVARRWRNRRALDREREWGAAHDEAEWKERGSDPRDGAGERGGVGDQRGREQER